MTTRLSRQRMRLHARRIALLSVVALAAPLKAQAPAKPKPAPAPIIQVPVDHEMEDAFPGLKFEQPLGIVTAPEDKKRLFIVEKTGRVQVIKGLDTDKPEKKLFLDLTQLPEATLVTEGECGVLGLAFPPEHAKSGLCFVYYSLKIGGMLHQRLSRFQVSKDDPNRVDNTTEQPLFTQADEASNHNGGDLQFGPDGYLYVTVGDGGAGNDKFDNARFINKGFHAAILRLDVDKKNGSLPPNPHPAVALDAEGQAYYAVPSDNPFIGATKHHGQAIDPKTVRTEIWATGLRNPWRLHFDTGSGRVFCADVGQNLYEEVDLIARGGDYGWSYREGTHAFPMGPGGDNEPVGFSPVEPIFEYPRTVGLSITGGVVYRGSRLPKFRENYIFADYVTGRVIGIRDSGSALAMWKDVTIAQEPGIAGIGIDPRDGEVLFANIALGQIKRLKPKAKAQ